MKQLARDLEKDLFEKLAEGPRNITKLTRLLHCRRANLIKIIEKHRNTQLYVEDIGNAKVISLIPHNFEQEHKLLVGSMNLFKDTLDKLYIPKLKKKKPIFKDVERFKNSIQYWVNPNAKEDLNIISSLMDQIMQFSFNLTYNDALDLIPKKFQSQFKEDQKLCVKTMQYFLVQLKKLTTKKNEDVIRSLLFNKKRVLHKLKA